MITRTNKKSNKLIDHNALLPYYLIALMPLDTPYHTTGE